MLGLPSVLSMLGLIPSLISSFFEKKSLIFCYSFKSRICSMLYYFLNVGCVGVDPFVFVRPDALAPTLGIAVLHLSWASML